MPLERASCPGIGWRTRALLLGLVLLSHTGCETTGPGTTVPPARLPGSLDQATPSEQLALARTASPRTAAVLYLNAAWALLEGADLDPPTPVGEQPVPVDPALARAAAVRAAAGAYHAIEPGWLDRSRLPDYHLLAARVAVLEGDLQLARAAMAQVPVASSQSRRALETESQICALDRDFDCALDLLLRVAEDDLSYNEQIWQYLNAATRASASQPGGPTSLDADPVLADWRALHRLTVTGFSLAETSRRVADWLASHPAHPASLAPPAAVRALAEHRSARYRVGLLLPLSGPVARAGEAVRDGFIGASLLAGSGDLLDITIYDAASEAIPLAYERLLADDPDLIVGPLQRESAAALNALAPQVPVLLLNYLDQDAAAAPGVRQFGLAIEDEAATIATRLAADDIRTALLFHNYEDWSMRARRALTDASGQQLTVQPFTDMRTITEAVGSAMHVAGSQERRDELASILGLELEFLPRARGDVEAVVALIDNVEATALVPALRFHFADHLPVYASSQVARGRRDESLAELNGFRVSELPWFLAGNEIYASMRRAFALDTNPYASLVALGVDAFRIADRLQLAELGNLSIAGSTGVLTMGSDGRISRGLVWGRIRDGRMGPDVAAAP